MTGQGASLKQAQSGSEKYHLCEGCVFILAYFHPLAESWRRRGEIRALNLRCHHVTPDDAKISSETAFFFIPAAAPAHRLRTKTSRPSPPRGP